MRQPRTHRLKGYSPRRGTYRTGCGWEVVRSDESPTGWLTTGYVHTYDPSRVVIADADAEPTCRLCRRAEGLDSGSAAPAREGSKCN